MFGERMFNPPLIAILMIGNVALLLFGLKFLMPKKVFSYSPQDIFGLLNKYRAGIIVSVSILLFHGFVEVFLLDGMATEWINSIVGEDYFTQILYSIEGDLAHSSAQWNTPMLYIFFGAYAVVYPFLLWFMPTYFVLEDGDASNMAIFMYPTMYAIQLPFMLFFPVTNVYKYLELESALELVLPGYESSYYLFTTVNNCFPSLHVAFPFSVMLISSYSENRRLKWFTAACVVLIAFAVFYLSIHWLLDVIGGIALAVFTFILLRWITKRKSIGS